MPESCSITSVANFSQANLDAFVARECQRYINAHPRSRALGTRSTGHWLFGVPLHWMRDWPTPAPLFVERAHGCRLTCADGRELIDFCLGDTAAMFGHSPEPISALLAAQGGAGMSTMLPATIAAEVGELLAARFGLPYWQLAATASDANRFVLRWARAITERPCIAVFNGCYHGTVDDTLVDLEQGRTVARASLLGQVHDLTHTTRVVEFNDLSALEVALADGQVACVLTEPVLTNVGMVLPEPGFLEGVQMLARRHGTLFVLDETHTISCGPGGYARAHGLEPDIVVLGKPIAGGLPAAVYGFSAEVAQRMAQVKEQAVPGHSGIGTTLAGGMMTLRLIRTMLAEVMGDDAYARMIASASACADGLRRIIADFALPWCVTQIGARCEYQFRATPPRNAGEARAAFDDKLEAALHLGLLNRGVLLTPFHNMLLFSPEHGSSEIDTLLSAFADVLDALYPERDAWR